MEARRSAGKAEKNVGEQSCAGPAGPAGPAAAGAAGVPPVCIDIPEPSPVLCRRVMRKRWRSISRISSEFMHETYTNEPAWLTLTPWGMSHAGRVVSGVIVAV